MSQTEPSNSIISAMISTFAWRSFYSGRRDARISESLDLPQPKMWTKISFVASDGNATNIGRGMARMSKMQCNEEHVEQMRNYHQLLPDQTRKKDVSNTILLCVYVCVRACMHAYACMHVHKEVAQGPFREIETSWWLGPEHSTHVDWFCLLLVLFSFPMGWREAPPCSDALEP